VAVASKHVREHPPAPRQINPGIPPDLEAIIMKCMAKSPDHRYASGDELRIDLMRFREGRAVAAGVPPTAMTPAVGATGTMSALGTTQSLPPVSGPVMVEEERSRTGVYAGILLALLVALGVVLLFLGNSLGWWHLSSSNSVTLPNLAGQNVATAEATLRSDGLKSKVQADPTSNQPNTKVLRTQPASGSQVTKGQTITLITGNQGNKISVPDETNQSVQVATNDLQGKGLQVQVQQSSNCAQVNIVCDQNPKGGQQVNPGSSVVLFTAPASTPTTGQPVPDVTGDTVAQACNRLGQAGFVCGSTTQQPSNTFASGAVISTNPSSGTPEPQGTTVNLVVSSGPSTVTVPNVVGMTTSQAVSRLQQSNLVPVESCTPTANRAQDGVVQSQNPAGGESVPAGSTVNITYASFPSCSTSTTSTTTTTTSGFGGFSGTPSQGKTAPADRPRSATVA
jgi:serine/threonine-protein kinase